jgi:hypothetical protein
MSLHQLPDEFPAVVMPIEARIMPCSAHEGFFVRSICMKLLEEMEYKLGKNHSLSLGATSDKGGEHRCQTVHEIKQIEAGDFQQDEGLGGFYFLISRE